jgi:hypothetical protein
LDYPAYPALEAYVARLKERPACTIKEMMA